MNYKNYNDYELFYLIKENDENAQTILIEKYQPIIKKTVKKYLNFGKSRGLDSNDLYQEAMIGFYKALKKYDSKKNNLFYTYVNYLIEGNVYNAIKKSNNLNNRVLNESLSIYADDGKESIVDNLNNNQSITEDILYQELIIKLKEFLYQQSDLNAQVLELKMNHFKTKEISILLDIDSKKIDNIIYNMRKKLKDYLG